MAYNLLFWNPVTSSDLSLISNLLTDSFKMYYNSCARDNHELCRSKALIVWNNFKIGG